MRLAAAPRWAVSFADLGLLLLGCFVYLHAVERSRPEARAAPALRVQPGAPHFAADRLFEAGEARLLPAARVMLNARARTVEGPLLIVSRGTGQNGRRFDAFELAAARAAAVARALGEGQRRRVSVRMDEAGEQAGQTLSLVPVA
jgi:flagellar motor protein MotB